MYIFPDYTLKITRRERKKGRLTRSNLAEAIRQVRESGFVVLERVLPDEWVSMMRTAFDEETELYINPTRMETISEAAARRRCGCRFLTRLRLRIHGDCKSSKP